MAETALSVTYKGPVLTTGLMPVRDLAPALLSLGDVFAEASLLLYPDREPVALSIKATERGSFDVHLLIEAKSTWDQLVDIFGSDGATAIVNLKEAVVGAVGLVLFIKHLNSRRVARRDPAPSAVPGAGRYLLGDEVLPIGSRDPRWLVRQDTKFRIDELMIAAGERSALPRSAGGEGSASRR